MLYLPGNKMMGNTLTVVVVFVLGLLQTVVSNDPMKCEENCLTCSKSTGLCSACKPGKWGPTCEKNCRLTTCLNNACDIVTGDCTYGCMDGMYSTWDSCVSCPANCKRCKHEGECTECPDGLYGPLCDNKCSRGCGQCKQTYSGKDTSSCLKCSRGKYGIGYPGCLYDCSLCRNGACSVTNCTYGCIPGYYNYKSITCVKCFPDCGSCNVQSFNNKKCLTCPPGRWGDLCDQTCTATCESNECDQSTGLCNCDHGYDVGPDMQCRMCPDNCQSCDVEGKCQLCKNGYFSQTGEQCETWCYDKCRTCSGTAQNCTSCPIGRFLRDTECRRCPHGCSKCSWVDDRNGVTCSQCITGFYKDIVADRDVLGCYKCAEGCSECDWQGECLQCAPNYHLFLRRCCPTACAECVSPNHCTVCAEGYTCDLATALDGNVDHVNITTVHRHQPSGGTTIVVSTAVLVEAMVFGAVHLSKLI